MLKKINIIIVAGLLAAAVSAEEVQLQPNHPNSYTVQKGDTLWDISGRFLTKPWLWPDIWHANPQIKNPDLIYPGDVLTLVYKDGKPTLELSRGEQPLGGRNFKRLPSVREYAHAQAIQAIPIDAIRPFLSRPLVVARADFEKLPYVVSSEDQHLVNGGGHRIYVRGNLDQNATRYTILRLGDAYRNAGVKTGEILGYEALDVGDALVERFGDPATVRLVRSTREVLNGDRLIPQTKDELPQLIPHAPTGAVAGNIVDLIDGVAETGRHQIVVLNVGKHQGVEPGHVLGIFQSSLEVRDDIASAIKEKEEIERPLKFQRSDTSPLEQVLEHVANDVRRNKQAVDKFFGVRFNAEPELVRLPAARAGNALVFRTFDDVSYALVMSTSRPVHVYDAVGNP